MVIPIIKYVIKNNDPNHISSFKDTLEYKLADKFGKFMGSRNINITEISLLHKENIHFENNKYYNLTIEHAMRGINKVKGIENLKGIIDIGYKIKKID